MAGGPIAPVSGSPEVLKARGSGWNESRLITNPKLSNKAVCNHSANLVGNLALSLANPGGNTILDFPDSLIKMRLPHVG